jgi:ketosteroid isomerase-like protein
MEGTQRMSDQDDIAVIRAFHALLESRDVPGLLALATDDIGVGGGRGRGEGKAFFAEWVRFATISLTPRRWFRQLRVEREGRHGTPGERASVVVVEEDAVWRAPSSGREMGRMRFATIYEIENGLIRSVARYGNIGEAVTTAGLYPEHEIAV